MGEMVHSIAVHLSIKNFTWDIISRPQMNVSTALVTLYATLHIGQKVSVNQVPAIYTSLPRALAYREQSGHGSVAMRSVVHTIVIICILVTGSVIFYWRATLLQNYIIQSFYQKSVTIQSVSI